MSRRKYETYEYIDPDNCYTYEGASVLRNKLDIKDGDELQAKEYQVAANKLVELGFAPIEVYSMKDILAIHRFIFGEIYEWAGKYRMVNISKEGYAFMSLQSFDAGEKYINSLLRKYYDTAETKTEIAEQLAGILDNLNHMHPFREGNGRTQREVIRALALAKGYYADINVATDDDIYHLYMDGTVEGNELILTKLFLEILEKTEDEILFEA